MCGLCPFILLHFIYINPHSAMRLFVSTTMMEQGDAPAVVLHRHIFTHTNNDTPTPTDRLSGSLRESAQREE